MSDYPIIQTIRYMGNKSKLLDSIIPKIKNLSDEGDIICDLMSGTSSVSYALKNRNSIIANDIQYYSYIISKCMLCLENIPTKNEVIFDLENNIEKNKCNKEYSFFYNNYTDTYFSEMQCLDIDSIRYSIELSDNNKKYLYLTLLMYSMCKCQSTPGHFAQYMDKNHKRIIPLRKLSIKDNFYNKLKDFNNYVISKYSNYCFNLDYNLLLEKEIIKKVKCFYLDSPYTNDQYSRFYHILETVCKYDNPILEYKAKYRNDRYQSLFCYKKTVNNEFEKIINFCKNNNSNLVISYSNKGVLDINELVSISSNIYKNIEIDEINFNHSSQGNGNINIKEYVISLIN